jgi:dipeptidyl aminopeptidase/acylaminoacyl peptidase
VTGYSYGGFMTTWIVGHTQRFKAAVAGACVSNTYSFWGTSDIGTGFGQYEHGGALPHAVPEHYLARSPVHHLTGCETPLLLLHHEGDLRCPIGQSEEVFAVLRKLGKEAVLVRYPGGYHTYATHAPSQRVDAMQRTNEWFKHFIGAA